MNLGTNLYNARKKSGLSQEEVAEKLGVSRAQAEAMLAGSMFGWQTQAADPCSYDEQGRILTPKQRFQKERGEAR